jgi:hypothetical protein
MKETLGWASTIVGSVVTALGGNPYLESINEFLDVLQHAANDASATDPARPAEKASRTKQQAESKESLPADVSTRYDEEPDSSPEDDVSRR